MGTPERATATAARPTATEVAATATVPRSFGTIAALQISHGAVARGGSQAVVVVATAGTSLTVTVTYPSGDVANYRGSVETNGVYRVSFIVPASAGVGTAHIRVIAPSETSNTSFTVS